MIFKQFYLPYLSHASYLIGDQESGLAMIVDPQRDVDQYLREAENEKLNIHYIVLTHFHADFVSGHLELQDQTDAKIFLGSTAQADYVFQPVISGDAIEFGSVRCKVLETPGHTLESISLLVFDLRKNQHKPYAILTGDTLLLGDIGHPNLMASAGINAQASAANLYDSLHNRLLPLPKDTLVYPAHVQGSLCGKNLSKENFSTLGIQKRHNYALQPMTKEAFIELVTTDQPEPPRYFPYDTCLNRRERSRLEYVLQKAMNPLTLDQVLRWKTSKAQMIDVRDPLDFATGYLVDSINIGLNGQFERWAGTLLHPEDPIVIIAEPGREREAVLRLSRIGFDHVVGYLKNGFQALHATPELVRSVQRITAEDLNDQLMTGDGPYILDVRTHKEWSQRRINHSSNIPLSHLTKRLQDIPQDRDVVVHSSGGYRSSIAASLLHRHGFFRMKDLVGGFDAWEQVVVPPAVQSAEAMHHVGER